MKRRVAITGIGAITPLGIGMEKNWEKVKKGVPGISKIEFPGSRLFPHSFAGSVSNFDPADFIPKKKMIKLMNREAQMAVSAAGLAIADAGMDGCYSPHRTGLYLGTGLTSGQLPDLIKLVGNSIDENDRFSYRHMGTEALPNCNPLLSFKILTNMPLCYISILFQVKGPNMVFNPWSGNTAQAIGEGIVAIQQGDIDCAIVGGCDSKTNYVGFLTFTKLGLLSKKGKSRPFDKNRDGIVLSEGACILVLEDLEKAESRNANIYAELSGYATVTDPDSKSGWHPQPMRGPEVLEKRTEVLEKTMKQAVSDSGLDKDGIDLICAAANSHPVGDLVEARAVESLFKGRAAPPVIAVKTLTGDMIAAAAPFELAVCALALKEGILPAGVAPGESDENIRLRFCKNKPEKKDIKTALSNSFEFGNSKVSLTARRYS
ncbi:MAG: beta-ketoacyl-[acyl-carrier-protein] synthase family protein [Candidatus Aminicenantes bacterium]|nr:beta-ketoacyl-[acyl-carrier-protein] synthase family protein [Candidatus Aminicenantes bacterium]